MITSFVLFTLILFITLMNVNSFDVGIYNFVEWKIIIKGIKCALEQLIKEWFGYD